MLVFIDESGDSGLGESRSSSKNLIITLVLFEDRREAQRVDDRIAQLRRELNLQPHFEFHFSKLKQEWREHFLRAMGVFDFSYFSIILDKQSLKQRGYTTPTDLYRYACHLVFQAAKPCLRDATVVIDGSGTQKFQRDIATHLRQQMNGPGSDEGHIGKVRIQNSHTNNLLQLADMVCGAVARSLSDKPRAGVCRKLISHCEMDVSTWPR